MKITAAFLFSVILISGSATLRGAGSEDRPNVVFILADDLGYGDLGCYGCEDIATPHLDRLASEGVRLTDFYANAPVCTPTRYALMTGQYQARDGLEWAIFYQEMGTGLPENGRTIADLLGDGGYATATAGKWHLGYDAERTPTRQGFDRFLGLLGGNHHYFTHVDRKGYPDLFRGEEAIEMEGYSTDLITKAALEFLREMKEGPFFLYLAYNAPHFPFQGPDDAGKEVVPGKKSWQTGDRATYVKMVERIDDGVGEIVGEVERLGLTGHTLIVFTSDNGGDVHSRNAPLAKGKGTLWEGGIRVPCMARWPGVIPAGRVSAQTGMTMDWTATMAALAGVTAPENKPHDGIDLMPFLKGAEPVRERALFWRRVKEPVRKQVMEHRAVRRGKWKYIDEQESGARYLYDLEADIGETENLVPAQAEIAGKLKRMLDAWEAGL